MDNFIYRTQRTNSANDNINITLRIKMLSGELRFAVKRCTSAEEDNTYTCICNKSTEVYGPEFAEIVGIYHNYTAENLT